MTEQLETDAEAIIYDFEELVAPVVKALKAAYSLKRRPLADIEWRGPNISNGFSLSPSERLTAENLQYSQESQGRFAIDEIIGIAVSLGIEQGKNLAAIEFKKQELLHQAALLIVRKERVNAALDNAHGTPPDEPTEHEAFGAMIYRGKHEARTANGGDDE